jgi:hypothetical protein
VLDDIRAGTTPPTGSCQGLETGTGDVEAQGEWTRAAHRLWCIATHDGAYPSRVRVCVQGCLTNLANRGANHNKFVLFEGPSADQRIVWSSSANWQEGYHRDNKGPVTQLTNKYQTTTVVRNDTGVYNAVKDYWNALNSGVADPDYGDTHYFGASTVDVHFYPQNTRNSQLDVLNRIKCDPNAGHWILISTNLFTPDNAAVANRLKVLKDQGCGVRVVVKQTEDTSVLVDKVNHWCIADMHRKDMIIKARYIDGGAPAQMVFTGSRPFGPGRTSSDNLLLRLNYNFVDSFIDNFNAMWSTAEKCTNEPAG